MNERGCGFESMKSLVLREGKTREKIRGNRGKDLCEINNKED